MPKIVEKKNKLTFVPGKRPCEDQKQALLSFLEDNLPVARNQFDGAEGYKNLVRKWCEAAELLNAVGPPNSRAKKEGCAWKKYFEDWRIRTKKKYTGIKQRMEASGVNGVFLDQLSDLEQKLVGIVTLDSIDGDGKTTELGVPSAPISFVPSPSALMFHESMPPPPSPQSSSSTSTSSRATASSSRKSHVEEEMQLLKKMADLDEKRFALDVERNKREEGADKRSTEDHAMKMELYRTKMRVLQQQINE